MPTSQNSHLAPVGAPAPDFELHSTPDQTVTLEDFRGRPVVLAFYPADWSPVCGDQMALYNEMSREFEEYDAAAARHLGRRRVVPSRVRRARKLQFPLLADFEPKGEVSRRYGAYRPTEGISERALFVIDADGRRSLELPVARSA